MNWRETQSAFAAALRDPSKDVPGAVGPRDHDEPLARFNVYRNNTAVSLTEAVGDSYPVVRALVGDEFFTALARAYASQYLPETPVLIHYGDRFADFIDAFEQTRAVPYLADVARVEWAWLQAYHAADRTSINADALQSVAPEALNDACLELHPSVHLLRSDWPAVSIWSAHQSDAPEARQEALAAIAQTDECGLIVRPEFEVNVQLVQPAAWQLLAAFRDGSTLGDAAAQLEGDDIEHFGGMLGYIFSTGAISAIHQK
ncbi:MAG: HvfC/BufC N-terminal domain-containing protein [Hyphomicrobiaceae bacterium]